jgi:flagellar FliJ protein
VSALKSIELAIEVATRRRDQADQALMQARRAVQFAQTQLDQLESYAVDTQGRWSTAAGATSSILLHHHYQFMDRLQHAIGLQAGVIEDLKRQAEMARQRCLQEEVRVAGLKQVMKKKLSARDLLLLRREQRQMDELASLKHTRSAAGVGDLLTGEQR